MNKIILFALAATICSCSSDLDELDVSQPLAEIAATEETLSFSSENEFDSVVKYLSSLSEEDRTSWVNSHYAGFTSLQMVYNQAMEEADNIDESDNNAWIAYKNKYGSSLYFSSYKDDCGVYLPVSNDAVACLLAPNGNVIIGGELVNKKDIVSYSQLQAKGVAMYDENSSSNMFTRAAGENIYRVDFSKGTKLGDEYDTGWKVENKRKIRAKLGRQVNDVLSTPAYKEMTIRLHLEISFRKKTTFGWANYTSKTTTTGTFTGGYQGTIDFYKHADSSHDWYQTIPYSFVKNDLGRIISYSAPINADLTVEFRGIENPIKWAFTLPEVSFVSAIPTA